MRYFINTRVDNLPRPEAPTMRLPLAEIQDLLEKERQIAKRNKTTTRLPKYRGVS